MKCTMVKSSCENSWSLLPFQPVQSMPSHMGQVTGKGRKKLLFFFKSQGSSHFTKCYLVTSNTVLSKQKPPINKWWLALGLWKEMPALSLQFGMAPSNSSSSILGGHLLSACGIPSEWKRHRSSFTQAAAPWSATALRRKQQLGLFAAAKHPSCLCFSGCIVELGRQTQLQTGKTCSCWYSLDCTLPGSVWLRGVCFVFSCNLAI